MTGPGTARPVAVPGSDAGTEVAADLARAAAVLALDPFGLGGAWVRGPAGPERDAFVAAVAAAAPTRPFRKVPAGTDLARITGGLSVADTLRAGRPVVRSGLAADADGGWLVLPGGPRTDPSLVGSMLAVMDRGVVSLERDGISREDPARTGVLLLDESREGDDEGPPAGLRDRLAFWITVPPRTVVSAAAAAACVPAEADGVRRRADRLDAGHDVVEALTATAAALGIDSLRAPTFALRVARLAAALRGADAVEEEDAVFAVRTVLVPRATVVPAPPAEAPPPADPDPAATEAGEAPAPPSPSSAEPEVPTDGSPAAREGRLADRVVAAAVAVLPERGPHRSGHGTGGAGRGSRAPARSRGPVRRGRVRRVAPGDVREGRPVDVLATVRAAAPWQAARGREEGGRLKIVPADIRVRHLEAPARRATVFVVDGSGSHAMHRLAEAKGAVELLLAEAYVRREEVALVLFRDRAADVVLPLTRSPARARRVLSGLPGGGGTPLASGLLLGLAEAEAARRAGKEAGIVVLTDGKSNVDLAGRGGRPRAHQDALDVAGAIGRAGIDLLVLDTSPRGQEQTEELARAGRGRRVRLPNATSSAVRGAIRGRASDPGGGGA